MARFTVAWEEFLEIYEALLPRPSIASFLVSLLIATATGVFGAVLTYAVDPGSKLLASVFLWLSLLMFVAALWDLKARTARRRDSAIKGLQAVHKRYHSSPHTFAFDTAQWVSEAESGRQEVPWTALQVAVERPHVLELAAKNLYAVVPK